MWVFGESTTGSKASLDTDFICSQISACSSTHVSVVQASSTYSQWLDIQQRSTKVSGGYDLNAGTERVHSTGPVCQGAILDTPLRMTWYRRIHSSMWIFKVGRICSRLQLSTTMFSMLLLQVSVKASWVKTSQLTSRSWSLTRSDCEQLTTQLLWFSEGRRKAPFYLIC